MRLSYRFEDHQVIMDENSDHRREERMVCQIPSAL